MNEEVKIFKDIKETKRDDNNDCVDIFLMKDDKALSEEMLNLILQLLYADKCV